MRWRVWLTRLPAMPPPDLTPAHRPEIPRGRSASIRPSIAQVLGALIPENAIITDESVTTGAATSSPPLPVPAPHDWLHTSRGGRRHRPGWGGHSARTGAGHSPARTGR